MPGFDVHQHLWPVPFTAALAARTEPPLLRSGARRQSLVLDGEPECPVDSLAHDPHQRAVRLAAAGLHRALVAISSPIGVEALDRPDAEPLLAAWNDAVLDLGSPFGVWGAVALDRPDAADVDALLDRGAVGISLPAGALAGRHELEDVGRLLEALARRDAPLLVHPGPGRRTPGRGGPTADADWWAPLTSYVAQLQAAWLAFAAWGRPAHPRLRVLFVALAGGAPLHAERIAARGGPADAVEDPLLFYDTSSYGPLAVEAAIRSVGIGALVHGSDAPVVAQLADPGLGLGTRITNALTLTNPARLLHGDGARLRVAA